MASDLPELRRLLHDYGVGWTTDPASHSEVAIAIRTALLHRNDAQLKARLTDAGRRLRWELEKNRLLNVYGGLADSEDLRVSQALAQTATRGPWHALSRSRRPTPPVGLRGNATSRVTSSLTRLGPARKTRAGVTCSGDVTRQKHALATNEVPTSDRVVESYDAYARSRRKRRAWSAANPGNRAIRGELADRLSALARPALASGGEALDVGCGTGWWLARLASDGVPPERLHGIELLEDRVAAARKRSPDATGSRRCPLSTVRGRALRGGESADGAVVVPSGAAVAAVLSEARRVVRPGGLVLVYEPRLPQPFNRRTRTISVQTMESGRARPLGEHAHGASMARVLVGALTPRLYPRLSGAPMLLTHRLMTWRRPADG